MSGCACRGTRGRGLRSARHVLDVDSATMLPACSVSGNSNWKRRSACELGRVMASVLTWRWRGYQRWVRRGHTDACGGAGGRFFRSARSVCTGLPGTPELLRGPDEASEVCVLEGSSGLVAPTIERWIVSGRLLRMASNPESGGPASEHLSAPVSTLPLLPPELHVWKACKACDHVSVDQGTGPEHVPG